MKNMNKLVLWVKITAGKISMTPINRMRFIDFIKDCLEFKLTIEKKKKPKSEKALGFYFANILPSIIAHDKGLVHRGQIQNNPMAVKDLIRQRKISWKEIENKHRDIMVTFRPDMATNILTKETYRVGQELKEYDNTELCILVNEVMDALEPEGYEFGDSEEYKALRDGYNKETEEIEIDYPEYEQPFV